jgi:hypothetical protein
MLYDGWVLTIAKRFQEEFGRMRATYNFDHGPEYELAVCHVLREILPKRFGVCRGFVVGRDGTRSGDDIIIYDAHRCPTLRGLGDDLASKEDVPADAVYAYIEAKHTLYVTADEKNGQSLAKATRQVQRVKSIAREHVENAQIMPGLRVDFPTYVAAPPGFPRHRNPYYGAIWARNVDKDDLAALADRLVELSEERDMLPDIILAGPLLAQPMHRDPKRSGYALKPFLCASTELMFARHENALGLAGAHLLWALNQIRLADVDWGAMLHESLRDAQLGLATGSVVRGKAEPP